MVADSPADGVCANSGATSSVEMSVETTANMADYDLNAVTENRGSRELPSRQRHRVAAKVAKVAKNTGPGVADIFAVRRPGPITNHFDAQKVARRGRRNSSTARCSS